MSILILAHFSHISIWVLNRPKWVAWMVLWFARCVQFQAARSIPNINIGAKKKTKKNAIFINDPILIFINFVKLEFGHFLINIPISILAYFSKVAKIPSFWQKKINTDIDKHQHEASVLRYTAAIWKISIMRGMPNINIDCNFRICPISILARN